MSWLYSQALVEEFSQGTCSAGALSALLSTTPTPLAFWSPGRTTDACPRSRFGMTYGHLTGDLGAELLTWCREGSHVRTSALRGGATDLTANAPASGHSSRGWFAKYDPDSSTWKTAQCSLLEDSGEFSETWPRSGSMRNGHACLRPSVALLTSVTESGLWPTPVASDTTSRATMYAQGGSPLSYAVRMWPTPTVCGNYNRKEASATSGDGLATAVRMWPTPCASASKGSSPAALTRKNGRSRANDRIDHAVMASEGGPLNPAWVEWLMGWPIGHTDLKPLATGKFLEWQRQHSPNSREDWSNAA